MGRSIWQDWVNLILGVWLIVAPWVGVGPANGFVAWNSYIPGVIVAVFALVALARPQKWEEWINLIVGVYLIVSPFVFGYTGFVQAAWNHVIVGLLIAGDAIWAASVRPMAHPTP